MGYGTPLENQNKGYDAQEKKDLMKMPGAFKQMSKGSVLSKHMSTPLAMGGGTPAQMHGGPLHKQGYNSRLDETLGSKDGNKSQSMKDRRNESEGEKKSKGKKAYSSDTKMK